MCAHGDHLYIFCADIYKVDPETGEYEQMTTSGDWNTCTHACVIGKQIYVYHEDSGYIYSWPIDGGDNYEVISSEDWANYLPIIGVKDSLMCFGNNSIWIMDMKTFDSKQVASHKYDDLQIGCFVPSWNKVLAIN
jgi:Tol biopolymer transport system component